MTIQSTGNQSWLDLTHGVPPATPNTTGSTDNPAATKEMFLQLLVAQIKNQNPLDPQDPAEFLSQLSQFTGVEQMLEMREELEGIHGLLADAAAGDATEGSSQNT